MKWDLESEMKIKTYYYITSNNESFTISKKERTQSLNC